jgi:hypothetical protein
VPRRHPWSSGTGPVGPVLAAPGPYVTAPAESGVGFQNIQQAIGPPWRGGRAASLCARCSPPLAKFEPDLIRERTAAAPARDRRGGRPSAIGWVATARGPSFAGRDSNHGAGPPSCAACRPGGPSGCNYRR